MELKAGVTITDRIHLIRPIAKGGMGSVWVAYHENLKTEVAVKFVEGSTAANSKARTRFEREASIAAKLKNPHVAHMYDHGLLDDGTPYIVMELLEGESLQDRLLRGPLTLHETALVVSQAAQALGKAHKLGIIHRDVKPANLFLIDTDYELFVKLLDFGIAKHGLGYGEVELTKTGNLLGSPLYMSPEQFTKVKSVDFRADLWSLSVVAYRCLAGTPPFNGEALGNVLLAVVQRDYVKITDRRPEVPEMVDDWFAKAFHNDVAQRYQSAKELAISFTEVTRTLVPTSAPPTPPASIGEITEAAKEMEKSNEKTAQLPEAWHLVNELAFAKTQDPPELPIEQTVDSGQVIAEDKPPEVVMGDTTELPAGMVGLTADLSTEQVESTLSSAEPSTEGWLAADTDEPANIVIVEPPSAPTLLTAAVESRRGGRQVPMVIAGIAVIALAGVGAYSMIGGRIKLLQGAPAPPEAGPVSVPMLKEESEAEEPKEALPKATAEQSAESVASAEVEPDAGMKKIASAELSVKPPPTPHVKPGLRQTWKQAPEEDEYLGSSSPPPVEKPKPPVAVKKSQQPAPKPEPKDLPITIFQ